MAINVAVIKVVSKSVAIILSGTIVLSSITLLLRNKQHPHYVDLAAKSIHLQQSQGVRGYVVLGIVSQ